MADRDLKYEVVKLAETGCRGNCKDFAAWLTPNEEPIALEAMEDVLRNLVQEGVFTSYPEYYQEYSLNAQPAFDDSIEYVMSGRLTYSPIQLVRSRLESFLKYHGAGEEDIMDVTIGTTEAMENAVKYSDLSKEIRVTYSLKDMLFEITIINSINKTTPEADIINDKYNRTLMRGVMVMTKLFDVMTIDYLEDTEDWAVFKAQKKITPA